MAAHVARRDGLPLPIARTRRFTGDEASEEGQWQEGLIRHIRLPDWEVLDSGESLDIVGDIAQRFLTRHGVVFPAPMFVQVDSIATVRGGSHLTGEGGDEILGLRRAAYARLILQSPRGLPKRLSTKGQRRTLLDNISPRRIRQARLERVMVRSMPGSAWVRPDVAREIAPVIARQSASEPLDWRDSLAWQLMQPQVQAYAHNLRVGAQEYDVLHLDPLLDPLFVNALARSAGRFGYSSRPAAMEFIAGDLLPRATIERRDKAAFNTAYFTSTARRFVESWDGEGVDTTIVNPEALRQEWMKPFPPANSFMLLQEVWLRSQHA